MIKNLADVLAFARKTRRRFSHAAQNSQINSLSLLVIYMRPYRRHAIGAAAALLASSALLLTLGQGVRRLIDLGFGSDSEAHLDTAALGMFCVVALLAVATFSRFYLVSWLSRRLAAQAGLKPLLVHYYFRDN